MKRNTRNAAALMPSIIWASAPCPCWQPESPSKIMPLQTFPPSQRSLIVKLRPNYLRKGLNVAQIRAELSRPLAAETVSQIQGSVRNRSSRVARAFKRCSRTRDARQARRQAIDRAIAGLADYPMSSMSKKISS